MDGWILLRRLVLFEHLAMLTKWRLGSSSKEEREASHLDRQLIYEDKRHTTSWLFCCCWDDIGLSLPCTENLNIKVSLFSVTTHLVVVFFPP